MGDVCVITLEGNGDAPYQGKGLKVLNQSTLRFILPLGSDACCFSPELHTNYPVLHTLPFERHKYHFVKGYLINLAIIYIKYLYVLFDLGMNIQERQIG